MDGSRGIRRTTLVALAAALAAGCVLVGCGGDDDSSGSTTSTAANTGTPVKVEFEQPRGGQSNRLGYLLLKANALQSLGNSFSDAFDVPKQITVLGVNGFGSGPFFTPDGDRIVIQYGFSSLVFNTMAQIHPTWTRDRLGTAVGAIGSFVFAHEFTHALISVYDLPVLGRQEDAADDLATLILLQVPGKGGKFVIDSADFWAALAQMDQRVPTISDYADAHSLDLQRAFEMLCLLAGSSKEGYEQVASLRVLPTSRLKTCPEEFQETAKSFEQVLDPHVEGGVNFGTEQN